MSDQFLSYDYLIANRVVHVWQIQLDRSEIAINQLVSLLSDEEQIRAKHFYFDKDRNRFIIAHGSLRIILASYLNIPADKLIFSSNFYVKPFLQLHQDNRILEFNLSHSNNLGILSVTY